LLDEIVSSMMEGEKDDGKGMKNAEQWCFSIGGTGEKLLSIGVSAMGENERLLRMVLQQRKGEKRETSAERSCFRSENDGGMGCFCDWEEMKSAEQRCFSIGERVTSVLQLC
jgi:hypothetical protein